MFKHKTSKLKYLSNVKTLDELHHNHLEKINKKKNELPQKKRKLDELNQLLNSMENNGEIQSTSDIKIKSNIRCQIQSLNQEIRKIEDNSEVMEYISKAGDLLVNYYNITSGAYYNSIDNYNDNENDITKYNDTELIDFTDTVVDNNSTEKENTGIYISDRLKYLNKLSQSTRKVKKPVKKRRIIHDTSAGKSILNFLPISKGCNSDKTSIIPEDTNMLVSRAALQDKYLMLVDKNYACDKIKNDKVIYCNECKEKRNIIIEKILCQSDGCYVCKKCGETEHIIMESETPSHKELSNEKQKYPYKKINHLREKLNQFQSKESADVPEDICNIVRNDLRKKRIRFENCIPPEVKSILKKHRLTNYYEHLQQIYCKISGTVPITLSRDTEETVINMFQAMQESFRRHCPVDRSNFLSYSYVLNKIFRILDMKEHAKYFGLLKSKEKLREQDIIWKKICKDMDWKFYSSF